MKGNHSRSAILDRSDDAGWGRGFEPTSSSRLHVIVVQTSEEGTVAALAAAAHLAKNLCAQIMLVAAEAVPIHFSLERPHVSADFLKRRLYRLICDAGIGDEEVTVQVLLRRSRKRALVDLLVPRSLLVIGGVSHWWKQECRMARWLKQRGHHVIFVNAADAKHWHPDLDRGRQAAFFRTLELTR